MQESIENFKALTVDDIKALYRQVSGSNGQVAIVGDFEVEPIKETLGQIFADWDSTVTYQRVSEPAPDGIKGERIVINTPDKKNATYYAALLRPMTDADPDYEALLIGNYVLGGGPLSSRLADRVRKKDGLSYTVGSQFRAESIDEQAMFSIYAISNPDNTEKVVATIEEVIQKYFDDGIEDEELSKAMASYLNKRQGGRAEDRRLASLLRKNLEVGRDMSFFADSDQTMENLTKDKVESAMKAFLNLDEMVIVTAGDFEKKPDDATDSSSEESSESPSDDADESSSDETQ
jgi:zinc protease